MTDSPWRFTSSYVTLPRENVDTDQIIPARFLTTTSRDGLGPHAFHDWRYLPDGRPDPDFPLNRPAAGAAQVLVAGDNFGCGSSREHAVWALAGAGFRAVVSSSFADIFRGNALGNGLLPIEVAPAVLAALVAHWSPAARLGIDLEESTLTLPDGTGVAFAVPPFSRYCLLHDTDELSVLLDARADVDRYLRRHRSRIATTTILQVQP